MSGDPREPVLHAVSYQEDREVLPVRRDGETVDLATGESVMKLFLRGPSGRVYVARVPHELVLELFQDPAG